MTPAVYERTCGPNPCLLCRILGHRYRRFEMYVRFAHNVSSPASAGPFSGRGTVVSIRIPGGDQLCIERAQSRQRLFLALALLTQVVLQWAWGVVLFVSPVYSQTNCSGETSLIFFLARFTAREINDKYMAVWVLWLLFSLGITLFMTVVLALTSPARARPAT